MEQPMSPPGSPLESERLRHMHSSTAWVAHSRAFFTTQFYDKWDKTPSIFLIRQINTNQFLQRLGTLLNVHKVDIAAKLSSPWTAAGRALREATLFLLEMPVESEQFKVVRNCFTIFTVPEFPLQKYSPWDPCKSERWGAQIHGDFIRAKTVPNFAQIHLENPKNWCLIHLFLFGVPGRYEMVFNMFQNCCKCIECHGLQNVVFVKFPSLLGRTGT